MNDDGSCSIPSGSQSPRYRGSRLLPLLTALTVFWVTACGPSQEVLDQRMAAVRTELASQLSGEELAGEKLSGDGVAAEGSTRSEDRRAWRALQEFYGQAGVVMPSDSDAAKSEAAPEADPTDAKRADREGSDPELVWVNGEGPLERLDPLIATLEGGGDTKAEARDDGPLAALREQARQGVDENAEDLGRRLADLELAASHSFLTHAFHAIEGRVDPRQLSDDWFMEGRKAQPLELLRRVRDGGDPAEVLANLAPQHPEYAELLEARERYQTLVDEGGWPRIPEGEEALEEGVQDPRVAALRQRLAAEGDLEGDDETVGGEAGQRFDEAVADAVLRFQERHGLEPDGVVGGATLEALNTSAEERLRSLDLNLERWHWMPAELGDHHLWVNIPEYRLDILRGGESQLTMNVIVGKRMHQTPVFSDTMTYLVLNPTWNIPRSIADSETVPKILSDPGYAESQGLEVVGPDGEVLPPSAVLGRSGRRGSSNGSEDSGGFFSNLFGGDDDSDQAGGGDIRAASRTKGLPDGYRIRQAPGPGNALGQIKFMFPNEHNIYLHDTPTDHLFDQAERDFSHGCIRVERPVELAEYLLRDTGDWEGDRIRETVESDEETSITLPEEMPVHLTYFTARVGDDGRVHFREDLYDHDQRLAEALDALEEADSTQR